MRYLAVEIPYLAKGISLDPVYAALYEVLFVPIRGHHDPYQEQNVPTF